MLSTLVLTASLALGAAAQESSSTADEVLRREQQRVNALTAGKLEELAEILSPTLTYTHSSSALDSKEKFLDTLRSGALAYKSIEHRDVQVRFPAPTVAILNGLSEIRTVSGGATQNVSLRFTMVYVKKDGTWLMEAWHSARQPVQP